MVWEYLLWARSPSGLPHVYLANEECLRMFTYGCGGTVADTGALLIF